MVDGRISNEVIGEWEEKVSKNHFLPVAKSFKKFCEFEVACLHAQALREKKNIFRYIYFLIHKAMWSDISRALLSAPRSCVRFAPDLHAHVRHACPLLAINFSTRMPLSSLFNSLRKRRKITWISGTLDPQLPLDVGVLLTY